MAEHVLIDRYLSALELELHWNQDAQEIIDEVADHLLESVHDHTRKGVEPSSAERRALEEFGDPTLVGRTFASSLSGGIAVPTQFTRRSGVAMIMSSGLWLAGFAALFISNELDRTRLWEGSPQTTYILGSNMLTLAAILLAVGIAGINRRHGGMNNPQGRISFWLAIAIAITAQAAWIWGGWATLLAATALLVYAGIRKAAIAPHGAGMLLATGGVLTAASGWFIQLATDSWAIGEGASSIAVGAGLTLFAAGLASLGVWLRSERPVAELDRDSIAAA